MAFLDSSGFTINNGHFTNVNNIFHNRTVVKVARKRQGRQSIWDDYHRVIPGDVRIEENISTASVRREYNDWDEGLRKEYELWRNIDARRNIGIASLRGEDKEDKFLCVTYDGPDALKAFKQDFNQFAHIRNVNVAQIFGYNDNERGLPALVFYDALVPLARIVRDENRASPLLYSYFAHQVGRMQRELLVGVLLLCELWVDPRTGALQKGPHLELPSFQSWVMHSTAEDTRPNTHSTHLPIQTYSDNNTVFKYLARTFTARTILRGIYFAPTGFLETLANEQVIPLLSSLSGAVYNWRSRDLIARLPGARERWRYGLRRVWSRIPDGMRESQVVMDEGSVRFTVLSTESQDLQGIDLQYDLYPGKDWGLLAETWLAQAHSVFSQLGIHEDDWKNYATLDGFMLLLTRTSPPQESNIPWKVYLFIRPVPCPSDDDATWRSWFEGEKYFWSFDSLGREMVPELVRAHLGLPSFASRIVACPVSWYTTHYDAVEKLHTSEGFDPTTTDLALSLGFPVLELIGDRHRFEVLGESSSNSFRRFADNLKARGARFITKAKVGFGAKKSDIAVISRGNCVFKRTY